MNELNVKLVKEAVKLLACEAATHPDFLSALTAELDKRGFTLKAYQRGINGTYLRLVDRLKDYKEETQC